jgi:hypothetical protein
METTTSDSDATSLRSNVLVVAIACSLLSTVLGCTATWLLLQNQRTRDLAMRPPIAVISVPDWMMNGSGRPSESDMSSGLNTAKHAIDKLQAEGVLVLDARAVRGGPDEVMLSVPGVAKR